MALNAVSNERLVLSRAALVGEVVRTIELLIDTSFSNQSPFYWKSALRTLHSRVKGLLRHGAKINHHLIFAQPSFAAFDTWLESKLVDHTLGYELSAIHEDIKEFYYEWAFLQDQLLFQTLLDSLRALATRDSEDIGNLPVVMLEVDDMNSSIPQVIVIDGRNNVYSASLPGRDSEVEDCFENNSKVHEGKEAVEEKRPIPSNNVDIVPVVSIAVSDDETEECRPSSMSHRHHIPSTANILPPSVPSFSYSVSPVSSPPDFSSINTTESSCDIRRAAVLKSASSSSCSSSGMKPKLPVINRNPSESRQLTPERDMNTLKYSNPSRLNKSISPSISEALSAELKKTSKSFLESDGYLQPPALGNFPLPQKGQSLTSFLASLSDTMPELDRENAHFNVSEALISAFERLKVVRSLKMYEFRHQNEDLDEMEDMFGTVNPYATNVDPDRTGQPKLFTNSAKLKLASSSRRFYSGKKFPRPPILHTETEESELEYWRQRPQRPPSNLKKKPKNRKLGSDGRSDDVFSTTEVSASVSSDESSVENDMASSSFSAENVALKLLRTAKMKAEHLPLASELQWIVSENDAPQTLLPLPKSFTSASESESEHSCKTDYSGQVDKTMRLRGTSDWAPPRPQIIFSIHPEPSLNILTTTQRHRCAGCGMKVDPKYASTFRYCYYLGRYFCTGCHTQKKTRLPQMILHKWDFGSYSVSNFSFSLLESLYSDPVYNALAINPNLTKKVKLNNFRNYRIQLGFLQEYLKNCKQAEQLYADFKKMPTYYTSDVDLFSLEDLINVRFGVGMPILIKDFMTHAIHHVLHCELCRNLGFVCEICRRNEVLFPFQINRVSRCPHCSSCYHLKCFNPNTSNCPKCLRVSSRRGTLTDLEISPASIAV